MTAAASGGRPACGGWVGTGRPPARGNPRMLAAAGTTVVGLLEQRVTSLTSLPRNTLYMAKGTQPRSPLGNAAAATDSWARPRRDASAGQGLRAPGKLAQVPCALIQRRRFPETREPRGGREDGKGKRFLMTPAKKMARRIPLQVRVDGFATGAVTDEHTWQIPGDERPSPEPQPLHSG